MTHEEIIAMAKEAGMYANCGHTDRDGEHHPAVAALKTSVPVEWLARFADLVAEKVAAKEREACEKACEEVARKYEEQHRGCFPDGMVPAEMGADDCVEAIRARGQKEGV